MMLGDGEMDMTSMFMVTSMMNKDCSHDTANQMNTMLPLLLAETEDGSSDSLKTILMFQMMSQGSGASLDMNGLLPMMMISDSDNEMSEMMQLLMLSNMSGAADYSSNFNMMLPLLMNECDENAADFDDCKKDQKDLMIMMMVMSSQSAESGTSVNSILPMLLMNEGDNNELLMMFMMMNQQQCLPTSTVTIEPVQPVAPVDEETIYRTWRINPDGTRTLVD